MVGPAAAVFLNERLEGVHGRFAGRPEDESACPLIGKPRVLVDVHSVLDLNALWPKEPDVRAAPKRLCALPASPLVGAPQPEAEATAPNLGRTSGQVQVHGDRLDLLVVDDPREPVEHGCRNIIFRRLGPNASGVYGASLDLHPEARRRVLEAGIERSEHIKCLREQVERLFAEVRVRDVLYAQSDD